MFQKNVKIMATINNNHGKRRLDYYVIKPDGTREYLVTRRYVRECYNMCKCGIRYNDLLQVRSRNRGEMNLVNYLKWMADYIEDEFDVA